ncbi:hypothetical protein [Psychrobacter aestuarii]|nr:hypothetical protein [Psychrobacter aestuarii]
MKQPDEKGIDVVIEWAVSDIALSGTARGLQSIGANVRRYR